MSLTPWFFDLDFDRDPTETYLWSYGGDDDRRKRQGGQQVAQRFPAVDVVRKDDEYVVSCDIPGVKKEDIKVSITHKGGSSMLNISGERKEEHTEDNRRGYQRIERSYGKFSRSFTLPDDADEQAIKAKQEHGVLKVCLPRKKDTQPKSNDVQIDWGQMNTESDKKDIPVTGSGREQRDALGSSKQQDTQGVYSKQQDTQGSHLKQQQDTQGISNQQNMSSSNKQRETQQSSASAKEK
jgi:HSP20 family protein